MSEPVAIQHKILTGENALKACVFLAGMFIQGVILFNNVKAEIHDNKTMDSADKQVINFRLQNLESHFQHAEAILPKEIQITPYR